MVVLPSVPSPRYIGILEKDLLIGLAGPDSFDRVCKQWASYRD